MKYPHGFVITGSIASGKSTVSGILSGLGYKIIDADKIAHEVLDQNAISVATSFGADILNDSGEIDRKKLGEIVFGDPAKLAALENILSPHIRAEIYHQASIYENASGDGDSKIYFLDIPLYFEKKYSGFGGVCVVLSSEQNILNRLQSRNRFDETAAKDRLNAQMPSEQKAKLADFIIHNNGDLEELKTHIYELLAFIKDKNDL